MNDLGNAYVAAGDVSNAIDTLREAVELQPGDAKGRALNDHLGNAYVAAGDVSNAINTLREAVEVKRSSGGRGLGHGVERSGQCLCGGW